MQYTFFGGYLRYKADSFGNTFTSNLSVYYIIVITLYHIVFSSTFIYYLDHVSALINVM